MILILALSNRKKNQPSCCPFFVTTDSEGAIFLTSPGSPIPCSSLLNLQDNKKYREGLFSKAKSKVMSFKKSDRNFLSYCDSLTTSADSKSLFLNNFKSFFNNGITQIKKWKQWRVEMFAHLSRYTPSSITPSNGEGGMVMVLEQIQLPLSRTGSKPNRFGKRVRKNFQQWKYDRMVKQKQERMAEHNRMLKGWLL